MCWAKLHALQRYPCFRFDVHRFENYKSKHENFPLWEKERNTWSTQFEWCVVHRAQVFWWSESTQTHWDENWKRVFICSDGPQNQQNETTMCWLISSLIAWFYWMLCRSVFLHSAFQYSLQSFVYSKFIVHVNLLREKKLGSFTSVFGTAHEQRLENVNSLFHVENCGPKNSCT